MSAPCMGCGERTTRCHAECGRYAEYAERQKDLCDERHETNENLNAIWRWRRQAQEKIFRRMKRGSK